MSATVPLVSAVVPCYRQGRYLARSVASLLAQTYPAMEIIVVNDGSDDDTDEVARGFGSRIVYVNKPNGGHSSARNAGLARATGEYLFFLDADDLVHPETVAKLVEAVMKEGLDRDAIDNPPSRRAAPCPADLPHKGGGGSSRREGTAVDRPHPTSPLLGEVGPTESGREGGGFAFQAVSASPGTTAVMGFRMFRSDGDWGAETPPPKGGSFFPWVLVRNYQLNGFLVPTALARAAGGFDSRMASHEDHEFWLRVALRSDRLVAVPFAGAYYRQHAASESRNPPRMIRGRRQLWARMVEELEAHPMIASRYGAVLLRQLYIGRLAMLAQAPEQSRADLGGLIRRLHRMGVRSKRMAIDLAYALLPPAWRDPLDHVLLTVVKRVKPRVYRGLTGEAGLGE